MSEESKIAAEIQTFTRVLKEGGVVSSIPSIQTYKSTKFIGPRLQNVFGERDIATLFAKEMRDNWLRQIKPDQKLNIISLGSGDCLTEFKVVEYLIKNNVYFNFVCTDLTPAVSEYAQTQARIKGFDSLMRFETINLNNSYPSGLFDIVLANHSLHHFVELEFIFDNAKKSMTDDGCFIVNDMIGRNGHARWPEALQFVDHFWNYLPLEKRVHTRSGVLHEKYINYDCTVSDPYEGIRAQDILKLLLERFKFRKFVAFGNIIDPFVDRIYGHNFSADSDDDRRFIDLVENINNTLIDCGVVKPTAMFAVLDKFSTDCLYDRWSPEFCLRQDT